MSKPFVPKVGTTAECAAFTGLKNEVVIDEEKGSLIVHDGVTAGGAHEILPKAKNDELYAAKDLDVGVTSFNGKKGDVTFSAPVTSVDGMVGTVDLSGVYQPKGSYVTSVNGAAADASGAVTISVPATPKAYVTETWVSGKSWYRKYSDGFIDQGGLLNSSGSGYKTLTLHKAFSDTNYTFIQQAVALNDSYGAYYSVINDVTTTTVTVSVGSNFPTGLYWRACGY